ncbi:hypothetical protein AgCh_018506 [Apium graveolens]
MAEETVVDLSQNPTSLYYIHPSDNPEMKLVSLKFDGKGYGDWKRYMMINLIAKNKIGFVDGSITKPVVIDVVVIRLGIVVTGYLSKSLRIDMGNHLNFRNRKVIANAYGEHEDDNNVVTTGTDGNMVFTPAHYSHLIQFLNKEKVEDTQLDAKSAHIAATTSSLIEPHSCEESSTDTRWIQAMTSEIQVLQAKQTWIMIPLPGGKKSIGCKWVYNIKLKADGTVERLKDRTAGQGIIINDSSKLTLQAFSDSDWGSCLDSRKLIVGYVMKCGAPKSGVRSLGSHAI